VATVAPISETELHDIYYMRLLLEGEALDRSVKLGDQHWEQQVRDAFGALEEAGRARSDGELGRQLHMVDRSSRVPRLALPGLPIRLAPAVRGNTLGSFATLPNVERRRSNGPTGEEHRAIFEAAMARDPMAARDSAEPTTRTRTVDLLDETARQAHGPGGR
jgi:DNA-binding GntR family transcriptional regulator